MKTLIRLLALVAALSVGWAANAQSSLAGYDFVTSTSANKWLALSSTTNLLTSSGDGVASTLQNIGFTFPFGGNTYTQFSVNSDGNLRLGGTQTGTGSYNNPFSSSRASYNNPKINFFGCDGYCVAGTHYVHAQNFTSSSGLNYLVVEFCLGTFASATQNVQYKWQVQLCENGNIVVAYPSTVPSQGPAVARQMGLCVDNQDGWIINSSNSATHFTNGVDTNTWSSGSWPNASRYYVFYRDGCTTIPNYDYTLFPSDTWNTHSSATDPFNAYCHKKVYRVWVIPGFRYTFKTGCDDGATADFDTKLFLYNSSELELASDDDGCSNGQSKIEYLANSREYLYLVVRGYRESNTGSYTLAYKQAFNPTYYSITPTSSYQTHSFTTSSTTPSKIYRFYVSSDDVSNHTTFFFKTSCGNGASASFDTWMEIRNANGQQLIYNDDGACGNTGSYIAYQPTQSGYLYLTVRGYGTSTGSYTLAYKKGCVDLPDYHYSITATNSWQTHSSQTSSGSCTNYKIYKTWVNEGYAYTFKTGCDDGATADFDTYLELYDTNGTRIAYADYGCESSRSKLSYLPTQSGYVYLKIRGYSSSYVGSYTLAYKREAAIHITTNANPTEGGWITGNGYYADGQRCDLSAYSSPGYQFTNWTEGSTVVSTDQRYNFTATADRTLTANFTSMGNCQTHQEQEQEDYTPHAPSSVYFDRFDHYTTSTTAKTGVEPPCWTLVPLDVPITDAYKPMIYYSPDNAYNGNYSLILNKRCIYAMPYVKNLNRCGFGFYVKQPQAKYQLEVGVMSDLNDASTFVPIDTINNNHTNFSNYSKVLDDPNFQGHYIAFRNTLAEGYTGDYSVNYIDNISITDIGTCSAIGLRYGLPYIDHFDRYTTSTTAKTGEEPPCWLLVQEDVTMTDEYKPMIYYSSANAHSGNYSLILNKRGIYRMPYSYIKIDTLQLDFYLKQTQAKYQLQVGVCSQDGSNFTPVATINNSTTNYEHVTVNFSSYTGTNRYIAFRNILAPGQTGDYSINYIDDLVLNYRPASCPGISVTDLPYTDNFDSYTSSTTAKTGVEPPCWTLAKQDVTMTDEYKPMIYYASANAHSGNYSLILNKRGIYAMPEFNGNVNTLQMSFYLKQTQAKYQLQVGVLSDLSNPSSFTVVKTINNSSTNHVQVNVDFSSYTGSGHYIAFRNVLASGQTGDYSLNYIDDLVLSLRPATTCTPIQLSDLPYTDSFDSYTTSHTAKTGVQPDCWTLAKQDVTMTDEYKPMIYYASANAHSGNYSLLLNKRGIYAMPEFEGNVNTLQLSMYLKQTATKYQLQVGVLTDPGNPNSFTVVKTINNSSTNIEYVSVDFSSYTGSGHYIAFRNVLASGQTGDYSLNYIDDLTLSPNTEACTLHLSDFSQYIDNFDSYTTSTTPKTGVEPPCWTLAHQDVPMTDEYKPMIYYSSSNAFNGSYSLLLNKRGIYAMPYFDGDIHHLSVAFAVKQPQDKYWIQMGAMSDLNDASTFVPMATISNSGEELDENGFYEWEFDFYGYKGFGHYIAFRNVLAPGYTGDYSVNYIDHLYITYYPNYDCAYLDSNDLPYTYDFDSYTTSTTPKTGVEPGCWKLLHEDVPMTDEYKPMIYYSSTNAHSGNYSLILNKRGMYAMREYYGVVGNLKMDFYLKQTQAKYQLQVGVVKNDNRNDPDYSTFVPIKTINNSTTNFEHVTVDFSSYSGGKDHYYIAFRNILASGQTGDYSLNYIDDLTLSVNTPSCTLHVADLPYTDNYDSYTTSTTAKTGVEPPCWTLAHQDVTMTNEYKPMVYYGSATAHSGNYSLILNKRGIYAMPYFDGSVKNLQLSMYLKQSQTKYQLQVGVMTSLSNPSSFVTVATLNNSGTGYVHRTVDFSSYTGSGHYIAFRNVLASGQTGDYSCNYIDDLRLETRCSIYPDELPFTDNFDSYTTSTTAKTGVQPDCWTLAHQDVTMTNEYKPMIYYGSSTAYSGNYSLILNKRGIYAMPRYTGNVNSLQLSFYLKQTQTKYQLQVGVMSSLSDASTFVPVATFDNTSTTSFVLRTVNFSSYTGSGHYIAFRNILASGQTGDYSCNYIDNINLRTASKGDMPDDVYGMESTSHTLTLYPNPTTGILNVEADEEVVRVDVFDYTGRCVASFERQTTVDLSRLATGLYTLRVTLPERIEVRRVVKQ